MKGRKKPKATGYDKYVDWKMFSIPVVLFFVLLLIPTPYGMKDVGTEYRVGPKAVVEHICRALFDIPRADAQQWQLLTAQIMAWGCSVMKPNSPLRQLTRQRPFSLNTCKNCNVPTIGTPPQKRSSSCRKGGTS